MATGVEKVIVKVVHLCELSVDVRVECVAQVRQTLVLWLMVNYNRSFDPMWTYHKSFVKNFGKS